MVQGEHENHRNYGMKTLNLFMKLNAKFWIVNHFQSQMVGSHAIKIALEFDIKF